MKELLVAITVSLTFCLLAFSAAAGPEPLASGKEMKEVAPAPVPECDWTGFYVGIYAGGEFGHSETKDLDGYNFEDKSWGYSESSFVGGGQVGYNWQWHWLVLGPEFDLGYMDLDGRALQPGAPGFATRGETNSDFYTTLRGRVGVALDCWMVYATGGGIGVNYDTRFIDSSTVPPSGPDMIDAHKEEFDWGYTVGGGVERRFGRHWSVKAEYLYFALDTQSFRATDIFGASFRFNGETTGHILRAGLNYKF
jgi:outer membrane immunogenic protein